jgi:hypothetical protein
MPMALNDDRATTMTIIDNTRLIAVVRSFDRDMAISATTSILVRFSRLRLARLPIVPKFISSG